MGAECVRDGDGPGKAKVEACLLLLERKILRQEACTWKDAQVHRFSCLTARRGACAAPVKASGVLSSVFTETSDGCLGNSAAGDSEVPMRRGVSWAKRIPYRLPRFMPENDRHVVLTLTEN